MIAVIIAILILVSKRRRKNLSTTGNSRAADTGRSLNIVFFEDSRLWARQCMYSVCMTDRRAGQVGQRQNLWKFYLKWKFPISLQVRLLVGAVGLLLHLECFDIEGWGLDGNIACEGRTEGVREAVGYRVDSHFRPWLKVSLFLSGSSIYSGPYTNTAYSHSSLSRRS